MAVTCWMYLAGACGLPDLVCLTGVLSTYPAFSYNWNIGFALTASPFWKDPKGTKRSSPHRTAFAALRFPRSGPAPWARRDGPSMAQHGSPGIHAGRPTAQNLHSASRWGGRSKSTARARARARARSRSRSRSTIFRFQGGVTVALRVPTGSKHHLAWAPDRLSVTCRSVPSGWSCPTPCTGRPAVRR